MCEIIRKFKAFVYDLSRRKRRKTYEHDVSLAPDIDIEAHIVKKHWKLQFLHWAAVYFKTKW